MCSETNGDCHEFVNKYLKVQWVKAFNTETIWKTQKYPSRICTAEDITQELSDKGHLYLCPPKDTIVFKNHFDKFPAYFLGIEIKANYDSHKNDTAKIKKMVNNFQMSRSHINSHANLEVIKSDPIIKSIRLFGRI